MLHSSFGMKTQGVGWLLNYCVQMELYEVFLKIASALFAAIVISTVLGIIHLMICVYFRVAKMLSWFSYSKEPQTTKKKPQQLQQHVDPISDMVSMMRNSWYLIFASKFQY